MCVCMYACMYAHTNAYVSNEMHACSSWFLHILFVHVHTHIYSYICMHICMYIYTHICIESVLLQNVYSYGMYVIIKCVYVPILFSVHVRTYVCIYVCMYVCMYALTRQSQTHQMCT